jgi:predicted transcriptional regulator
MREKITVRLSDVTVERLDELAPELNRHAKFKLEGPWNRSQLIRWAIRRGIEILEREIKKKMV